MAAATPAEVRRSFVRPTDQRALTYCPHGRMNLALGRSLPLLGARGGSLIGAMDGGMDGWMDEWTVRQKTDSLEKEAGGREHELLERLPRRRPADRRDSCATRTVSHSVS